MQDDLAFLEAAYARTLARPIDPQALRQGLQALASGMPREEWLARLEACDEARARPPHPAAQGPLLAVQRLLVIGPAARFVEQAWLAVHGSPASVQQRDAALDVLRTTGDRKSWLRSLIGSADPRACRLVDGYRLELDARELDGHQRADLTRLLAVSDDAFVHLSYWRLLGRAPDPGARAALRRRLLAGARREDLLNELLSSPEGRASRASLPGLEHPPSASRRLARRALGALRGAWKRGVRRIDSPSTHH